MKDFDQHNFVFIGAGNMAEALIKGLLDKGSTTASRIRVVDLVPERLTYMKETYGVEGGSDTVAAAAGADVLVTAVKPQQMDSLLESLAGKTGDALMLSIAAGIPTQRFESILGEGTRVVRVMPNTPSLVGMGAAGICGGAHATEDDLHVAETFLSAVGVVIRVDEAGIDIVTALSGSGPAYGFYLIEGMMKAAEALGFDREQAQLIIPATIEGAARMCRETGVPVAELRARVTSKGGTTAAAIDAFDAGGMMETIMQGVAAAHARSKELSE